MVSPRALLFRLEACITNAATATMNVALRTATAVFVMAKSTLTALLRALFAGSTPVPSTKPPMAVHGLANDTAPATATPPPTQPASPIDDDAAHESSLGGAPERIKTADAAVACEQPLRTFEVLDELESGERRLASLLQRMAAPSNDTTMDELASVMSEVRRVSDHCKLVFQQCRFQIPTIVEAHDAFKSAFRDAAVLLFARAAVCSQTLCIGSPVASMDDPKLAIWTQRIAAAHLSLLLEPAAREYYLDELRLQALHIRTWRHVRGRKNLAAHETASRLLLWCDQIQSRC